MANRALLVENGISTAVAESAWLPVSSHGLAFRIRDLMSDSGRCPDHIPPDLSLVELEKALALGTPRKTMQLPTELSAKRPAIEVAKPFHEIQPRNFGTGDSRAALIIAHGALRLFFPAFPELGDHI